MQSQYVAVARFVQIAVSYGHSPYRVAQARGLA